MIIENKLRIEKGKLRIEKSKTVFNGCFVKIREVNEEKFYSIKELKFMPSFFFKQVDY